MPTYEYRCSDCEHHFEKYLSMKDNKQPEGEPCPECGAENTVYQSFTTTPKLVSGVTSPLKTAGSGWQDVLKGIKKASGKNHTIHD